MLPRLHRSSSSLLTGKKRVADNSAIFALMSLREFRCWIWHGDLVYGIDVRVWAADIVDARSQLKARYGYDAGTAVLPVLGDPVREFRAWIWHGDPADRIELRVWAKDAAQARSQLMGQYGDDIRTSIWNEEDAARRR